MSTKEFPSRARTVIVGNSLAYHLAERGREDIVLIDKGPLPDPGGSTGHASNFLMPVEHSKELCHLTQRSIEQYREFGLFTNSGGIEVARTDERIHELHRRVQSANAWGEDGRILDVEEVEELVPYLEEDVITGGFYVACGISGAVQHMVDCKGAEHVLAVNTDPEAAIVQKADWAVVADLHEVVPAVTEELRDRQ